MGIPILQELLHKVLVGSGGTLNFEVSHIYSHDIFESLPPLENPCLLYYMRTKYRFTEDSKHTQHYGGRCMIKLRF